MGLQCFVLLLFIVLNSRNLLSNNGTPNQTEEGCETKSMFFKSEASGPILC